MSLVFIIPSFQPICEGGARGFITVGLQEVKPALYLLLIGTSLSLLMMFVEVFISKTTHWCDKHKILEKQKQRLAKVHKKLKAKY